MLILKIVSKLLFILGNCSPMILEERENKYVHLLKTHLAKKINN